MMMMLNEWKGHEEKGCETECPGGHTLAWEDVVKMRREEVEKEPDVVIGESFGAHIWTWVKHISRVQ